MWTCGQACASQANCTAANYFPTNQTCTLLNVEDVDDWVTNDNVTYICMDCEPGPKAAIGLWTFIDETINLRNPISSITTFNTPFVPAVPGGNTNVISFFGHRDSYVLLENTGDLAVSSFTWSTISFRESTAKGPLINWGSDSWQCWKRGVSIWLSKFLVLGVCGGSSVFWVNNNRAVISVNQWHDVAVSYDGDTGYAQLYVDGNVFAVNIGLLAKGQQTSGPVVMGSLFHYNRDKRYFQGKMACMRLWNIARDLTTMRMDTPLCNIN